MVMDKPFNVLKQKAFQFSTKITHEKARRGKFSLKT
jgi:hypothetical protein